MSLRQPWSPAARCVKRPRRRHSAPMDALRSSFPTRDLFAVGMNRRGMSAPSIKPATDSSAASLCWTKLSRGDCWTMIVFSKKRSERVSSHGIVLGSFLLYAFCLRIIETSPIVDYLTYGCVIVSHLPWRLPHRKQLDFRCTRSREDWTERQSQRARRCNSTSAWISAERNSVSDYGRHVGHSYSRTTGTKICTRTMKRAGAWDDITDTSGVLGIAVVGSHG
ncbi:hypothetical protein ACVIWU_006494 [Bradyrhizobium sp. USDA 4509]